METANAPAKKARARRSRRKGLEIAGRILVVVLFLFGIYFSAKLGIRMAENRLSESEGGAASVTSSETVTLGRPGDPLYLAESPEALRRFFNRFPSPGERASADLSRFPIRRLSDAVEMTTIRAEADAVEVRVSSGAIAGAVYWIHHSQMPDPSTLDPIISPVPDKPAEER